MGMQNVNPLSMQTAVSANLFPLLEARWNSPIKSMAMNSIGWGGDEKCSFLSCCVLMLCFAHTRHCAVFMYGFFHAFPVVSNF